MHLVGNTIVDSCDYILNYGKTSESLENIIQRNDSYYICTYIEENVNNFKTMWQQLNEVAVKKLHLNINQIQKIS